MRPPYRPDPARGRGRPRLDQPDDPADSVVLPLPSAPLTPIDRRQFDYSDLDHWMAQMEQTIRQHAAHPRDPDRVWQFAAAHRQLKRHARRPARCAAPHHRAALGGWKYLKQRAAVDRPVSHAVSSRTIG